MADKNKTVEIHNKVLLSFEEAAKYSGIGENKLRALADSEERPSWILYNGSHRLVKRVRLEQILLESETI